MKKESLRGQKNGKGTKALVRVANPKHWRNQNQNLIHYLQWDRLNHLSRKSRYSMTRMIKLTLLMHLTKELWNRPRQTSVLVLVMGELLAETANILQVHRTAVK